MKRLKFSILICSVWVILCTLLNTHGSQAAGIGSWYPDQQIPGYLEDTFTPFLLADQNRTIHAFASQWVDNEGRRKAIVYRQWTLTGGWTRPVDILLSPTGGAEFLGAYLDDMDIIHLIFMVTDGFTGNVSVYYSYAPAANADWAPAWSAPKQVAGKALGINSAAIVGDNKGNLVIIYSGYRDGNGVYSIHSSNAGGEWSDPLPVFLTYDSGLSAYSLRLTVSTDQRISAAWNVVTNLGQDETLYFASFDTQHATWSTPFELNERTDLPDYFGPSFPAIVDNGEEIVVFYNGGNPYFGRPVDPGRPVQLVNISKDNGKTWSDPFAPFPLQLGRSGEHALVLDGNGNPHALFMQRIEFLNDEGKYTEVSGIWHSVFQNDVWSNPERLVTSVAPHDVRAIVVQGNVLLVVWREDPGLGKSGIWFSYKVLDAPELPVVPLAAYSLNTSSLPAVTSTPSIINSPDINTPEPTYDPELLNDAPPSNLGGNPSFPIIISTVIVFIILIAAFGYRFLKRNQ